MLYDLEQLFEFSGGDKDTGRIVIRLFLEQTPGAVAQIKTGWQQQDLVTVAKVAHRIKPTIDMFGAAEASRLIRTVESLARAGKPVDQLRENIDTLERRLEEIMTALASDPILQS